METVPQKHISFWRTAIALHTIDYLFDHLLCIRHYIQYSKIHQFVYSLGSLLLLLLVLSCFSRVQLCATP